MDLQALCFEVSELAKEAGRFIRKESTVFRIGKAERKGLNDYVSYVDKQSEAMLKTGLARITPDCGFIAEESDRENTSAEAVWIIDPLDGTTNFIHGQPCYSVSIALQFKGELVLGVIYEVNLDELFYAWKHGGAWQNQHSITVSDTLRVSDSLIATGFPYHDFARLDPYMHLFRHLVEHSHGIRRLGSAAVDMAYVACGRFDAFYEYSLKPWDIAAGTVIVREAGGMVSDFSGGENSLHGAELISCNKKMYQEFQALVSRFFPQ